MANTTPPPLNDLQKLQLLIDGETSKLRESVVTMEAASALARQKRREHETFSQDIHTISARLKNAVDAGERAKWENKLAAKNEILVEIDKAMAKAAEEQQKAEKVVTDFSAAIEAIKAQAVNLGLELNIAEAKAAHAKLRESVEIGEGATLLNEIRRKTLKADATAQVADTMSGQDEKARLDEYAKAAPTSESH